MGIRDQFSEKFEWLMRPHDGGPPRQASLKEQLEFLDEVYIYDERNTDLVRQLLGDCASVEDLKQLLAEHTFVGLNDVRATPEQIDALLAVWEKGESHVLSEQAMPPGIIVTRLAELVGDTPADRGVHEWEWKPDENEVRGEREERGGREEEYVQSRAEHFVLLAETSPTFIAFAESILHQLGGETHRSGERSVTREQLQQTLKSFLYGRVPLEAVTNWGDAEIRSAVHTWFETHAPNFETLGEGRLESPDVLKERLRQAVSTAGGRVLVELETADGRSRFAVAGEQLADRVGDLIVRLLDNDITPNQFEAKMPHVVGSDLAGAVVPIVQRSIRRKR